MKTSTSKKATATNVKETKTMGRYSAYSCINTITKMIRMGATVEDITEKYGITESTLRSYLRKHFKRRDTRIRYNRLLRENAKAKQNESVEVVASETATESEESVEKTAEVSTPLVEPAKNFPDFFIIDPCLIQVYENRKLFGDIMEKLVSEHLDFAIYSKSKLERMAKKSWSMTASMLAQQVLEDKAIEKIETVLTLSEYSAFMEGIVITDAETKNNGFLEDAYDVTTFDEFLARASEKKDVEEKEDSIEYLRKLTIPVTLNKMGRTICDLSELQKYLKKIYGVDDIVNVQICSEDDKEKKTPTGKLMIRPGDTITFVGVENGEGFTAKISIIKNTIVDNAIETYYNVGAGESAFADNCNLGVETKTAL